TNFCQDGLPEQTQLWAADVELGHQIPKDLLFNSREDHLAYDPVGGARLRSRPPGTKFASCPRHVQGKRATVGGCASPSVHLSGGSVAILVTSSVTSRARTCKKPPMSAYRTLSGCSRISLAFSLVARLLNVCSTFQGTSANGSARRPMARIARSLPISQRTFCGLIRGVCSPIFPA